MKINIEDIKTKILNNKNIVSNVITTFFIRGGAVIVSLLTMPVYMQYFSEEKVLGVWFTLLSIMSWILNFDLGIGNGLRNHLVVAISEKDDVKAKKYISSSYISIGIIVIIAYLISYFIFPLMNWNGIFNIDNNVLEQSILLKSVQIIFTGIMLQFLLKLITSVSYAIQKSFIPNLLSLIANVLQLIYMVIANNFVLKDNLINLSYVHVLAVNLPLLITSIIIFSTKLKNSKPNIKYFDSKLAKEVMKLSGAFFGAQIMYMLLYSTNEFLITTFSGSEYVVEYQIYNKLFALIGTFFNLALIPIWSAVTKALAEQNIEWISKLYKFLKKLALLGVVCEFIFILVVQLAVNIWLQEDTIKINYIYAITFAIYGSIFIVNSVLSSVANGLGKLKIQLYCFTIGVILKLPIIYAINTFYNSWISVVMSTVIVMIPFCIIQDRSLTKYLKKK